MQFKDLDSYALYTTLPLSFIQCRAIAKLRLECLLPESRNWSIPRLPEDVLKNGTLTWTYLDIETEFSFDPIQPNNPYKANQAPQPQAASQAPPPPAAQDGHHHGGHGQQDQAFDQGNQAGQ